MTLLSFTLNYFHILRHFYQAPVFNHTYDLNYNTKTALNSILDEII